MVQGGVGGVLNSKTVLIPYSMHTDGVAVLEQRPDLQVVPYNPALAGADFHTLLHGAAAVALSYTPLDRAALAAAPGLQVAARIGVGFDAVDVPALTERRIPLMVVGIANSRSVAEHAVFFMFALAKRAQSMDRRVRQGIGHDRKSDMPGEVFGKTVLIVGFGRIGTRTAPRCQALGMHVLVYDPYKPEEAIRAAGCEKVDDLDAALPRADFVTIHCPKNPETIGMFDAARLARMKPGAYLVNTARGGLIDELALANALRSGHVGGAGLDVFDPEPPDPAHPLLQMPTLIASPHMAGVTIESAAAMAVTTAHNIIGVLDGKPERDNAVNPEVLDA